MKTYKNITARIYRTSAIVYAICAFVFLGFGILMFSVDEKPGLMASIAALIFAFSMIHSIVKYSHFKIRKHDKIYDAKQISMDMRTISFGRYTRFSVKVSYIGEDGHEKTGDTGYIFSPSRYNKIKDSKMLKIAVKPDDEIVILEIIQTQARD